MNKKQKEKKPKNKLRLFIIGVQVLIIAVLVNVLIFDMRYFFDATENNAFTLSGQTEDVLALASDDIRIKFFTSSEVPQTQIQQLNEIEDLLNQYGDSSVADISVEFLYPLDDEQAKEQADEYKIPEVKYNVVENEGLEVSTGYSGLVIEYQDKREVVPILRGSSNLEYIVTSNIKKLVDLSLSRVVILENRIRDSLRGVAFFLSSENKVDTIQLDALADASIDDVLLVAEPQEPYTEDEIREIDRFIMRGGKAVFIQSATTVETENLVVSQKESAVTNLVREYGVTINPDIVADFVSNDTFNYQGERGEQLSERYPMWAVIGPGLNKDHPISANIRSFLAPWANSIDLDEKEGVTYTRIAQTTDGAYAYQFDELADVFPETIFSPAAPSLSSKTVAVLAEGKIPSAFNDSEFSEDGAIFVLSAPWVIESGLLRSLNSNVNIVLSATDYFSEGGSLSDIRSGVGNNRPLDILTVEQQFQFKITTVLASFALLFGYGAISFILRKRSDKNAKKYI